MRKKPLLTRFIYLARNLRSRALFDALRRYSRGDVLDVGGWDFFRTARRKAVGYDTWTTLEPSLERLLDVDEEGLRNEGVEVVRGDGTNMDFADDRFDTVLNIQVLEHVFEPIRMVEEIGRVLRPGGHAILLVPQTSTTHMAPDFFGNFSRYWLEEAVRRAGLEMVEHRPLGGVWSSMASHYFYFFLQSFRVKGMSDVRTRRKPLFYVLFPLMAIYALVSIPICLLLGLGDLDEEPNNHLVVARKP